MKGTVLGKVGPYGMCWNGAVWYVLHDICWNGDSIVCAGIGAGWLYWNGGSMVCAGRCDFVMTD